MGTAVYRRGLKLLLISDHHNTKCQCPGCRAPPTPRTRCPRKRRRPRRPPSHSSTPCAPASGRRCSGSSASPRPTGCPYGRTPGQTRSSSTWVSGHSVLIATVALFGGMCWDREWLLYPNYNYPSWSYGVAVIAMVVNGVATFFMFIEARAAKERKERNQNLIQMMYPSASGFGTGTMSSYLGSQFI